MSEENNNQQSDQTTNSNNTTSEQPKVEVQPAAGSNDNLFCALAYTGLLFFLPLVIEPKTQFKTFHANQALLLLIFTVVSQMISYFLFIIFIGIILLPIVSLISFIFFILGIVNALNGKMERLPVIGEWDLLK